MLVDQRRRREDGVDASGNRIGGLCSRGGEGDRELIASEPANAVALTSGFGQLTGDVPKDVVSAVVPMPVVDTLELIEVDHKDANRFSLPGRRDHPFEKVIEAATIEDAGQLVTAGLIKKLRPGACVLDRER